MKLAKLLKIIFVLTLIIFTLSRKKVKKVKSANEGKIVEGIDELIKMHKDSKTPFSEIDKLEDKIYKLIESGDENDKNAALEKIQNMEDYDIMAKFMSFFNRIDGINYTNLIGTQSDFTGDSYDFGNVKETEYKQGTGGSACVLYSALYAISQNAVLKSDLNSAVKINQTSIVLKLGDSYFKVPKDYADTKKSSTLHPSQNIVLVAIGESILFKLKSSGLGNLTNYVIANQGKDVLFERNIAEIDHSNFDKIDFSNDGTLVVKSTQQITYSGNFVVSIGTTHLGGHAISAFFRNGNWFIFDNMKGELAITDLSKYKVISMFLIGNVQNSKKRKSIKRKLK